MFHDTVQFKVAHWSHRVLASANVERENSILFLDKDAHYRNLFQRSGSPGAMLLHCAAH